MGELQPELYFLAVGGKFHELVKRTGNATTWTPSMLRRGAWSRPTNPWATLSDAQRARRRLAGLARGTGSVRADCT